MSTSPHERPRQNLSLCLAPASDRIKCKTTIRNFELIPAESVSTCMLLQFAVVIAPASAEALPP